MTEQLDNEQLRTQKEGKIILIIFGSLLVIFLVYYAIMLMSAPARKLAEINAKYGFQQAEGNPQDERLYSDSAYLSLFKEKAFLQARISMAETDSIYLTLNIHDSTANLELSGVTVHSAKIKEIRVSKILSSGNSYVISSMFSTPFNIIADFATIKKEPLMIKMAPKDTSEFKPDIIPDTTDVEPVNYTLEMDNGIRIFVYQDRDTITTNKSRLFYFDLNDRLRSSWSSLKSVTRFKVPEYHPFIKIKLPKADAKIFYRAIPRRGQIAVYM
jgi:hypothetical protein